MAVRSLVVGLLVVMVAITQSRAAAAATRVALVDPDPVLERAVRVALGPWDTRVLSVRISEPGNVMPRSADRARELSRQWVAEAVVWISSSEDGFALWMYDARDDRVVARRLASPPPYDEPAAASVALTIKTLLRHSDVPPPSERFRAPGSGAQSWFSIGLLAGARSHATTPPRLEPRLGLVLSAFPDALRLGELSLGAAFELVSGAGVAVESEAFTGRWADTDLLLVLRGRFALTPKVDLGLGVGAGFVLTTIDGTIESPREDAQASRVNFAAIARTEINYWLTDAIGLGLRLGVTHVRRTQTYLVRGRPVLEVDPLALDGIAAVEVRVP